MIGILCKNKAANYPGQTEADIHKTPEGIQTRNPIVLAVENRTILGLVALQSALITFLKQFKMNPTHSSHENCTQV
jgi:hypothetical protein